MHDDATTGHLTDSDRVARGQLTADTALTARAFVATLLSPQLSTVDDLQLLAPEDADNEASGAWLLVWHDGPYDWAHTLERKFTTGVITLPGNLSFVAAGSDALAMTPKTR